MALGDPVNSGNSLVEGSSAGHRPLAKSVHHALRLKIVSGAFGLDEKLPSEKELAERFAVSRPIVREALRHLRDEGLIRSQRGAGSFVVFRPDLRITQPLSGFAPVETVADIQRCYDFRMTLEPDHAFWAALRWNSAALDTIAAAEQLLHGPTCEQEHRVDADFAFHWAIAEATNNHYYTSWMVALKEHILICMKFHGYSLANGDRGLDDVLSEHNAIFQAIRGRCADRARDLMRRHLEGSRDRVFEGRLLDLRL
jgi:GntR family transcriptional regulator, transcriptional repressor for pyruvate dehydrogenase complex